MNFILAIIILSGLDLYFLKDSPDLLVRVVPEDQIEQLTLHYSFSGSDWDSTVIKKEGKFFDTVLASPETLRVVGLYCIYDNGRVDDNGGALYLYEVKKFPRMLMPFSVADLEIMLQQARKKIISGIHLDEGITLLDYVDEMLQVLPVIENSPNETQRNILQVEVNSLREQLSR